MSYKKTGSAFAASITIYPVISRDFYGDFILTHFVAVMNEVSSLKHVGSGSSRSTSASSISQLTENSSDNDNEDETSSVSSNQGGVSLKAAVNNDS